MFTTGVTMGLAEWIIDDTTCLVFIKVIKKSLSEFLNFQKMGQEPKLGNFFKKCLTAFGKLAIAYKQNEEHEYSIDHQYGHLWLSDPSDNISNSCQCGLITKDECQERSLLSSLITGEIGSSKSHFEFQGKFKTCTDRKESVLLDDARMREVQFETAIEIASSLSMVKFVIEK